LDEHGIALSGFSNSALKIEHGVSTVANDGQDRLHARVERVYGSGRFKIIAAQADAFTETLRAPGDASSPASAWYRISIISFYLIAVV
jgi:hypothetical protein